ncbi:hypothetical protein F4778DRAFT_307834 [Xylariomycetidae sp. FL2044]|nr:hypothetical protein F4778DRAFT_307834 [Xylariomycetidae sp. FL2044]
MLLLHVFTASILLPCRHSRTYTQPTQMQPTTPGLTSYNPTCSKSHPIRNTSHGISLYAPLSSLRRDKLLSTKVLLRLFAYTRHISMHPYYGFHLVNGDQNIKRKQNTKYQHYEDRSRVY